MHKDTHTRVLCFIVPRSVRKRWLALNELKSLGEAWIVWKSVGLCYVSLRVLALLKLHIAFFKIKFYLIDTYQSLK